MKQIIINGLLGKMGQQILILSLTEDRLKVVAGVDSSQSNDLLNIPVFTSWQDVPDCDIVIDFSTPKGMEKALDFCLENNKAFLSGTTGLSAEQQKKLEDAGQSIPVLFSSNMSIGINITIEIAKLLSKHLPDYDLEILERHHKNKVDSPSGTAIMMAEKVAEARNTPEEKIKFGRAKGLEKRNSGDIAVHAIRGGNVIGEHSIYLMGSEDEIIIKHRAFSRQVFARGALRCANWLLNQENGFYSLSDTFTME